MRLVEIASIECIEEGPTHDIYNWDDRCADKDGGNFAIDGLIVHNSIPEVVANRDDKTQSWRNRLHPKVLEVLGDTFGHIVYQEQLTSLWQSIGGLTATEAQEARKAVAKKNKSKLLAIHSKWIEGATPILGEAEAEAMWGKMVTFGRYAFNKCLEANTILRSTNGLERTIEEWHKSHQYPTLPSYQNGEIIPDECIAIYDTGMQEVFEITFDNGQREFVTQNHKFLCIDGRYHTVREIINEGLDVIEANATESSKQAEINR